MAVEVTYYRAAGLAPSAVTHSEGASILVNNGHLYVDAVGPDGGTETVAIYAPGQWTDAVVR